MSDWIAIKKQKWHFVRIHLISFLLLTASCYHAAYYDCLIPHYDQRYDCCCCSFSRTSDSSETESPFDHELEWEWVAVAAAVVAAVASAAGMKSDEKRTDQPVDRQPGVRGMGVQMPADGAGDFSQAYFASFGLASDVRGRCSAIVEQASLVA